MKALPLAATLVAACTLVLGTGRAEAQSTAADVPTFTKDVAPILYEKCVSCHRPGQMAPMSLLTYAEARPFARSIRSRLESGQMPPWHAVAPEGTFLNSRELTARERDTIMRWVAGGAPRGNPDDQPAEPTFTEGWEIGTPDAVFTMREPFEVPESGTIAYQYFEIPTNFTEDKWISALEIQPDAKEVVHHILVFAREPGETVRRAPYRMLPVSNPAPPLSPEQRQARRAEAEAIPQTQRSLATSTSNGRAVLIATTAPGTNALTFRPGTGMRIKAGSDLIFQVHYTANGRRHTDRSSIGFVFATEQPKQEIRSHHFINGQFAIPPGATDYRVEASIEFIEDSHIWALFPHTHLRGRSWEYTLSYPDGRSQVVLSIPKYDFNWQTYYQYTTPIPVPKGSKLVAVATYDNSPANRSNPNPDEEVRWGEQTWEEMHYSGITFTVDHPQSTPTAQGQGQQQ